MSDSTRTGISSSHVRGCRHAESRPCLPGVDLHGGQASVHEGARGGPVSHSNRRQSGLRLSARRQGRGSEDARDCHTFN